MKDTAGLISKLREIRGSALAILAKLGDADAGESLRAMEEYAALVDRFNEACEDLLCPITKGQNTIMNSLSSPCWRSTQIPRFLSAIDSNAAAS